MIKVAIVEDDRAIRTLIKVYLEDEGFQVFEYTNGQEALEAFSTNPVDCIISDIMMPGIDGYTFCEEIRIFSDVPILMVTAKGEREDLIHGFQVGTDDYLVKPFDPVELVLRVKALLKRSQVLVVNEIEIENILLNRNTLILKSNQKQVQLKLKEYELFQLFASNIGKVLTRDLLIEKVWGFGYERGDRTLDVHISKLREHLEYLEANLVIKTLRGIGYGLEVKK
ncbi:response regulator transcription factor [Lysinibacillus sp. NPDC056959]|uniref:response regulator transcription factor n=1 Tax=Lysinibacillus sp. NPDC056959 TaxID=3345981 RepID=UPI0036349CC7